MDSPLQFPCSFPLKVMGENTADFEAFITSILEKHIPGIDAEAFSGRLSHSGKYRSLTIIFTAESREQLDAIYQELSAHKRILMAL